MPSLVTLLPLVFELSSKNHRGGQNDPPPGRRLTYFVVSTSIKLKALDHKPYYCLEQPMACLLHMDNVNRHTTFNQCFQHLIVCHVETHDMQPCRMPQLTLVLLSA